MAFLGTHVDAGSQTEENTGFSPIPSGEYIAMITDSDFKQNKARSGHFLALTYQVIDGPFKGRVLFCDMNLDHPNSQTVAIAKDQFSGLCFACGLAQQPNDSNALHNIPHVIKVEFQAANPPKRERDGNKVRGWKRLEGAAPQANPFGSGNAAAPAASSSAPAAAPSWANKAA